MFRVEITTKRAMAAEPPRIGQDIPVAGVGLMVLSGVGRMVLCGTTAVNPGVGLGARERVVDVLVHLFLTRTSPGDTGGPRP